MATWLREFTCSTCNTSFPFSSLPTVMLFLKATCPLSFSLIRSPAVSHQP